MTSSVRLPVGGSKTLGGLGSVGATIGAVTGKIIGLALSLGTDSLGADDLPRRSRTKSLGALEDSTLVGTLDGARFGKVVDSVLEGVLMVEPFFGGIEPALSLDNFVTKQKQHLCSELFL